MLPSGLQLREGCASSCWTIFFFFRKTSLDSPHEALPGSRFPDRYSSGRSSGRHKRTPSGSSSYLISAGNNQDNNGGEDYEYWTAAGGTSPPTYQNTGRSSSSSRRQHVQTTTSSSSEIERPNTLELPLTPRTPLRSSLKKNSSYPVYQNVTNSTNRWSQSGAGGGTSSGGTPTNPTPPDSISEEVFIGPRSDSGFVSGTAPTNRVRFSPSPFESTSGMHGNVVMQTDWSPTHVDPSRSSSRSRPHHFITESDLQRDFNIYP